MSGEPSQLVSRFSGRTVLVIGDLMVDHFVVGTVTRISPEAPVPIVRFENEEFRLGGAGNVANNIRALGGRAELMGVVGADVEGRRLVADLEGAGIGVAGIVTDGARRTTRKLRVVTTRNQQVARVDYEDDLDIAGAAEHDLIDRYDALLSAAN